MATVSFEEALSTAAFWATPAPERPVERRLVLVAGGSCSGKTTFASELVDRLGKRSVEAFHLSVDDYYRDIDDPTLPRAESRPVFDAPDSFHHNELRHNVAALVAGVATSLPVYDVAANRRRGRSELVAPPAVLVVEGLYAIDALASEHPRALTVFVDAPRDVRLSRRVTRDTTRYGVSAAAVERAFETRTEPWFDRHVVAQRGLADMVVISG